MALGQLGQPFDMHGGGLDLQFPHHENEIAQSEAATDKTFANYWVHVGLLQINQEKMSKSLHNFLTIQDVLDLYHPEVVRYFLLSSQYRSSLNYSADTLDNAHKSLARLYQTLKDIEVTPCELDPDWQEQFFAAMYDDFNTPVALAVLFQLSHAINKTKSVKLAYTLKHLAGILGILQAVPTIFLQSGLQDAEIATINRLVADRDAARLAKNWVKADEIRQMLLAKNIEIEDSSSGSTWRIIETNRS
jgi:cysteinyl-tRNA synthetase